MIPLFRLALPPLRLPRATDLERVRHVLKLPDQAAPRLPPETAPLPRLVLRELPRHLVEFAARSELLERGLLFGMFLTLPGG